jgi:hypothetical protein
VRSRRYPGRTPTMVWKLRLRIYKMASTVLFGLSYIFLFWNPHPHTTNNCGLLKRVYHCSMHETCLRRNAREILHYSVAQKYVAKGSPGRIVCLMACQQFVIVMPCRYLPERACWSSECPWNGKTHSLLQVRPGRGYGS